MFVRREAWITIRGDYGFGRELRIHEEIAEWEGITDVGKNYKVGRNFKWEEVPESGEMHEWEEITEPSKVQEWERFPSAGKFNYKVCEITVSRGICKTRVVTIIMKLLMIYLMTFGSVTFPNFGPILVSEKQFSASDAHV